MAKKKQKNKQLPNRPNDGTIPVVTEYGLQRKKEKKTWYGWAVIVKNVHTQRPTLFKRGSDTPEKWARILKTRKQAKKLYPEKWVEIARVKITILKKKSN